MRREPLELAEADPHTFGIPRLMGEAKVAMVEIQFDEYGSGDASSMHSTLFGDTLTALGLDPTYGSYVEVLPGVTLASVNLVSMFALHRSRQRRSSGISPSSRWRQWNQWVAIARHLCVSALVQKGAACMTCT
jgi:hypothetical protein